MPGPLTTQLVGSYAKPRWLIRHQRVTSFWRPEPDVLAESQDDATRLAIADQERAGLGVITDGEERRQRFDTYFFRFEGLDNETLGRWSMEDRDLSFIDLDPAVEQRLHEAMTTRVVGEIRWKEPVTLEDLRFLKRHTRRPVKMTVIGPLTAAVRLADDYYPDEETLGMAVAQAINQELRALEAEGLDIIQLDEPDFHFRHDAAVRWGTRALNAAFDDIRTVKAVHMCYGYATIGDKRLDPNYARALQAIAASSTDQICIEYEQPGHEPELLRHCRGKDVILGVLNLGTREMSRSITSPGGFAPRWRWCRRNGCIWPRTAACGSCPATWPSARSGHWRRPRAWSAASSDSGRLPHRGSARGATRVPPALRHVRPRSALRR